ncbi:MAG: 3-phosphoglycerate dehydrogenase, partial [Candidatus Kapabacteria bacterium]|nr:3-phosphoglycerate dehydrogenase [Candidatus Kapabacteria bacterium]
MRVLISDGIAPEGAEILRNAGIEITEQFFAPEDLINEISKYDGIIVRSATKVPKNIIDASKLKVIARGGVGVDNIDVAYAKEKGIPVLNTPGASSISVAEMALAHIFALNRFINLSNTAMRVGEWPKKEYTKGMEVTGKTIGIVGLGAIGFELAKRAIGLGMNVIYSSLSERKTDLNVKYVDLDSLLSSSDIISLHIPYDKSKGAFIGTDE